ncbi:hypothetical protein [Arthrobacter cheniae]|uniref:hypothetical protein n=1 Tax=Arthrobacter cheniae TaxID=1258888 RepID=UPI0015FF2F57|nr:hypothetical protein [Arthrobacter cheniae]
MNKQSDLHDLPTWRRAHITSRQACRTAFGGNRDGLQATVDPHPTASAYPSDVPADNR